MDLFILSTIWVSRTQHGYFRILKSIENDKPNNQGLEATLIYIISNIISNGGGGFSSLLQCIIYYSVFVLNFVCCRKCYKNKKGGHMNNRQQISVRISEGFLAYKREIKKGHDR